MVQESYRLTEKEKHINLSLSVLSPRALFLLLVLSQLATLYYYPCAFLFLNVPFSYQVLGATVVTHFANHFIHSALTTIF